MNYEVEIIKLLMDSPQLREEYPRICAVAHVVAQNEEDFLPYVWAYVTGKSDWKEIEKQIS